MEEGNSENLFLLECHVSELHIHSLEMVDKLDGVVRRKSCLTVSFLHFAELLLCDENNEEKMLCGKSFLFALPKQTLIRYVTNATDFVVCIKVYKVDSGIEENTHSLLGHAKITLGEKFAGMSRTVLNETVIPPSFSVNATFELKNENDFEIGTIKTFLRISCFGKMIVTQLHMAPDSADRELPAENIIRKITALTEKHISALQPAQIVSQYQFKVPAPRSENNLEPPAQANIVSTSTPRIGSMGSYEEFQRDLKIRSKEIDDEIKGKDWGKVFGYPQTEMASEEPEYPEKEMKVIQRPSAEEVTEPGFAYEEIKARVNGHLLFFKVLKSSKKDKKGEEIHALEQGRPTSAEATDVLKHRNGAPQPPAQIRQPDQLSTSSQRKSAQRLETFEKDNKLNSWKAKKYNKKTRDIEYDGFPCSTSPPSEVWNRQGKELKKKDFVTNSPKDNVRNREFFKDDELRFRGAKTPTTQYSLEKLKEAKVTETFEKTTGDKPAADASNKEIFSLNVGKKIGPDGRVRPKMILKILAPKTKDDIEEEEESAEREEKRLEKIEAKKKNKELITKETQYSPTDLGGQDVPVQVPKPVKTKAAGKAKKGKKR